MDKIKELLNKRKELMNQAETLVAEGKLEEFNAIEAEVKELDNKIEAAKLAQVNLQALQDNANVADLSNLSEKPKEVNELANLKPVNAMASEKLYENAFAKTIMGQELTQEENNVLLELNNHDTSNSGIFIPQTVLGDIINEMESQNPFLRDVRKLNIQGMVSIPKHTAITAGDAKGYIESEELEVEKNTFVEIQLGGKEVAKYIEVSFKLEAMAVPAFLAYLKDEIVDRLGVELGRQVISGDGGVREMEGVLTAMAGVTSQQTSYTANGLSYANVTAAIAKLGSRHAASAKIYASASTIWNGLANMLDGSNRPYFIPDVTTSGVGRAFGLVVEADSAIPEGTYIIGNAKGYTMNTNQPVRVESDRDIKARKTGFSAYTVVDGTVTHEKAFSILTPGV